MYISLLKKKRTKINERKESERQTENILASVVIIRKIYQIISYGFGVAGTGVREAGVALGEVTAVSPEFLAVEIELMDFS